MDSLFKKIKQIGEREVPFDISEKVFRKLVFYNLRLPLVMVGLFFVHLSFLCYRIFSYLNVTGAISIIKVIIDDFEMSWGYVFESWEGLVESVPIKEVSLLAMNVVAIGVFLFYVWRSYKSQMTKNQLKVENNSLILI